MKQHSGQSAGRLFEGKLPRERRLILTKQTRFSEKKYFPLIRNYKLHHIQRLNSKLSEGALTVTHIWAHVPSFSMGFRISKRHFAAVPAFTGWNCVWAPALLHSVVMRRGH
jgi:hypothetical protein